MKKLLLQLDCDKFASTFDAVTAYEAGVDNVLSYGDVKPEDVRGLLHGVMFTRPKADLRQTGVFIGGRQVDLCEKVMKAARDAMFPPYCISVMLDSNGCNTASAAAVALIRRHMDLRDARIIILSGFGPVGLRSARLLAGEGARVLVTSLPRDIFAGSWNEERARHDMELAQQHADEAGFKILQVEKRAEMVDAIDGATAVLSTGPSGVQLLKEEEWKFHPTLKILGDLNVAPPYGIEGIDPRWKGKELNNRILYGGLGIGSLKMKVHKTAVMSLFDEDRILDLKGIYAIAKSL